MTTLAEWWAMEAEVDAASNAAADRAMATTSARLSAPTPPPAWTDAVLNRARELRQTGLRWREVAEQIGVDPVLLQSAISKAKHRV